MGDGSPEESTEPLIPWEVPPGILRPTQVSSLSNLGAMPPAFNRGSQGSGTLQGLGNVPPCPGTRCAPLHNERVEPEDLGMGMLSSSDAQGLHLRKPAARAPRPQTGRM